MGPYLLLSSSLPPLLACPLIISPVPTAWLSQILPWETPLQPDQQLKGEHLTQQASGQWKPPSQATGFPSNPSWLPKPCSHPQPKPRETQEA